jgi:hypothetical protein
MANPRTSVPTGVGSCAAMRGTKMSEKNAPATVAPIVAPAKINEAAVSYSAYLRERGVDVSAEIAQIFWNFESEWRTSPERIAEREAAKAVKEAVAAKVKADREAKAKARLESEREAIAAKAKALGLIS